MAQASAASDQLRLLGVFVLGGGGENWLFEVVGGVARRGARVYVCALWVCVHVHTCMYLCVHTYACVRVLLSHLVLIPVNLTV